MEKNPSPDVTIRTFGREPHYGEIMRAKLAAVDARSSPVTGLRVGRAVRQLRRFMRASAAASFALKGSAPE